MPTCCNCAKSEAQISAERQQPNCNEIYKSKHVVRLKTIGFGPEIVKTDKNGDDAHWDAPVTCKHTSFQRLNFTQKIHGKDTEFKVKKGGKLRFVPWLLKPIDFTQDGHEIASVKLRLGIPITLKHPEKGELKWKIHYSACAWGALFAVSDENAQNPEEAAFASIRQPVWPYSAWELNVFEKTRQQPKELDEWEKAMLLALMIILQWQYNLITVSSSSGGGSGGGGTTTSGEGWIGCLKCLCGQGGN